MSKRSHLAALLLAYAFIQGANAVAAPITIFSTGVSVTNGVDDHYTITAGPVASPVVPGIGSAPAYLSTSLGGGWVPDTPAVSWISPSADANQSFPAEYYTYQTTFTLAGLDASTAQLSGTLAADDSVAVFLNGKQVLRSLGTWTQIADFSINQSFVSGLNTLDLVIHNSGGGPTGLDMAISGSANLATPEPSSYGLLAVGLLGLAALFCYKGYAAKRLNSARQRL
jgi:PEP-CTERM motif-containing protein